MTLQFAPAKKQQLKLRLALLGPAGAGKTYTALRIATAMGGKIALIDTEHGSASLYSDLFAFDTLVLESFSPLTYVEAITAAGDAGYTTCIIDSLSHAWEGKDGALEQVDRAAERQAARGGRKNSFTAWRDVTPMHNKLVEAMLAAPMHVIATVRTKMEYVQEKDEKGNTTVRKVGLKPIQRDGLEYEFTIVCDLDQDNTMVVGKTRCPSIKGLVQKEPGEDFARTVLGWLNDGEPGEITEGQTEALLDLLAHPSIPDKTVEKGKRLLRDGMRASVAKTWIQMLEDHIAGNGPAVGASAS